MLVDQQQNGALPPFLSGQAKSKKKKRKSKKEAIAWAIREGTNTNRESCMVHLGPILRRLLRGKKSPSFNQTIGRLR